MAYKITNSKDGIKRIDISIDFRLTFENVVEMVLIIWNTQTPLPKNKKELMELVKRCAYDYGFWGRSGYNHGKEEYQKEITELVRRLMPGLE